MKRSLYYRKDAHMRLLLCSLCNRAKSNTLTVSGLR